MPRKCCVTSCSQPVLPYFYIPISKPAVANIWAERAGRPDLKTVGGSRMKRHKICSRHFKDECRVKHLARPKLKCFSLPTLYLPGYFGEADIENSFLLVPPSRPIYTEHNYSNWGVGGYFSGVLGSAGNVGIDNSNPGVTQSPQIPTTSDVPTVSIDLPTASIDLPPLPPLRPILSTATTPLGLPTFPQRQQKQQQHENTVIISGLTITEVDEDDEPNPAEAPECEVEIPQDTSGESNLLEVNNLICRVCKGERKEMISLFSHEVFCEEQRQVFEIIEKCASVQIIRDDGLPQFACLKCLEELHQAFKFRRLCEKTDKELRKEFQKESDPPVENILEPEAEKDVNTETQEIAVISKENAPISTMKRGRLKQDFRRMRPILYNQSVLKNPTKNRKFVLVKVPKKTTESKKVSEGNTLLTSSESTKECHINIKQSAVSTEPKKQKSDSTGAVIEELDSIINNAEYEMDLSEIQSILPLVNFGLPQGNDTAKGNPTYSCSLCRINFKDKFDLKNHMKLHANKRLIKSSLKPFLQFNRDSFKCKICKKIFKSPVTKEHMRQHKMRNVYKCLKCNMKFRSLDKIRLHLSHQKCTVGQVGDAQQPSEETPLMIDTEVDS